MNPSCSDQPKTNTQSEDLLNLEVPKTSDSENTTTSVSTLTNSNLNSSVLSDDLLDFSEARYYPCEFKKTKKTKYSYLRLSMNHYRLWIQIRVPMMMDLTLIQLMTEQVLTSTLRILSKKGPVLSNLLLKI
eukprot:TRINITY_DN4098_c0_g1_i2.p1 TRINITY_DN4098_c0_g1~~TRINITY_DN4098_c0_g1_i2.p1  ORF type:complete len:131 (-),score=9.75 TRINITY_DN4098_c0_g1_i2:161-553(-)